MNLTQNKQKIINKKIILIYVSIIFICIVSIIVAFHVQFYTRVDIAKMLGIKQTDEGMGNKSEEEISVIQSEFDSIFTNKLDYVAEGTLDKRTNKEKNLIYTEYEKVDSKDNSYDVSVHVPCINIESEITNNWNTEIKDLFTTYTEEVLKTGNKNVIYTVEYTANVQNDIVSLIIRSNLKQGSSAQRTIIQTYNYDLRNNKEVSLQEFLNIKQLDEQSVQNVVDTEIKKEQKKVNDLKELGYNIYTRDIASESYKVKNSNEFYINGDTLYIIYAYGNNNFTSETDVVIL